MMLLLSLILYNIMDNPAQALTQTSGWALFDEILGAESLAEIGAGAQHELQVHKRFEHYTCRCGDL